MGSDMDIQVKPADLVEEFIQLRSEKQAAEARFEEELKKRYTDRMEVIQVQLLDQLNALGIDSISGKTGTAYKKISVSATIVDGREFRRHVIGSEQWELANWSVNKTVLNEMVERGEPIPPGINRSAFYTIGIRRKT